MRRVRRQKGTAGCGQHVRQKPHCYRQQRESVVPKATRLGRWRVSGIVTVSPLTLVTGREKQGESLGEWQDFHGMKELCMFLRSHPLVYPLLEDFNKDPEF